MLKRKQVKIAKALHISILATGGRHGYTTTLQKLQNGLAIDLSKLDTVEVDQGAGTLTIGGGVRVGQIFDPVYNAGFELRESASAHTFHSQLSIRISNHYLRRDFDLAMPRDAGRHSGRWSRS